MYDDVCKYIAEKFSTDLAEWLLGEPVQLSVIEPTELQLAPIRADSIIFLRSRDLILHVEFQTRPDEEIPFRMADYRLRIHRCFGPMRTYQVVIYLRETDSSLVQIDRFELPGLQHSFEVIRLWEIPAEKLLQSPGLLPFAVLGRSDDRIGVLESVAQRIEAVDDRSLRNDLVGASRIISALVLDKMVINRLLREEIMKESVIYQEIIAEGEARGIAIGEARGEARGIAIGEANLVIKLLSRRVGEVPSQLIQRIRGLSVEQLESLGENLFDFQSAQDLIDWFDR